LSSLSHVLRYELADAESRIVNPVRALFDKLSPTTLRERIDFFVKKVDWGYEDPDGEEEKDFEAPTRRAEALGAECASEWQTFVEVLPDLSSGESKHTFAFARALLNSTESVEKFVAPAIAALRESKNPNPSLLGGFISSIGARSA